MALETSDASAATEDERGQSCDCCKNPTHLSLPSPRFHVCSSGGLPGDLRGYQGPIPLRDANNYP